MDERTDRCRTFHGIGQPDVQGEHGTLTGTTDKHQHQSGGKDKATCGNSLGGVNRDKWSCTLSQLQVLDEREAERTCIVTEDEDTNKEEHVSKTSNDERLLGGGNSGMQRIVEADEQVRTYTHQLPEQIHLEDVGSHHQSEH